MLKNPTRSKLGLITAAAPIAPNYGAPAGLAEEEPKASFRLKPVDQTRLGEIRLFLTKSGRKTNDARVYLTALQLLRLNSDFLAAYDGHPATSPAAAGRRLRSGPAAPESDNDEPKASFRPKTSDQDRLKKVRLFLAEHGRKVFDGKVYLAALHLVPLDETFLGTYDARAMLDGRKRASI